MSKRPRDNRPYIPPVKRIELVRTDNKFRWILIAVLLAAGVTAIAVGLFSLVNTQPGWVTVEAAAEDISCSGDFVLQYDFSESGGSATAENKKLTDLYSQAAVNAFSIFTADVEREGVQNVYYLNRHPNEEITVDDALYRALELLESKDSRMLYLAPVYVEYDRVFQSDSDPWAEALDPMRNEEAMAYVQQIVTFTGDPDHIDLTLLGENRVKLFVSDEYLTFAEEYEIDSFVEFGWMKNAFIIDYLAEVLSEAGFTKGNLTSFDGFTRNLDSRKLDYSYSLFDRQVSGIYLPGVLEYNGPKSIVYLRNYPMDQLDQWRYYAYADGGITSCFIDPLDGRNKSSRANLVSYSAEKGCAEILLEMLPVFLSEEFSQEQVSGLSDEGIYCVWFEESVLHYNEEAARITLKADSSGNLYTKAYTK